MHCTRVKLPNGTQAIVCSGRPRRRKCIRCGGTATLQCDGIISGLPIETCDAHICAECSTPDGPLEYCREHAPL